MNDPQAGDIWSWGADEATPTGGTTGSTPLDFRTQVLTALLSEGIDPTRMQHEQIDNLVTLLWSSQRIQDEYTLYSDPEAFGPDFADIPAITQAKLDSLIRKELFDPSASDSSAALQAGISLRQLQGLPLTSAQENYAGASGGRVPSPFDMGAVTGRGYGFNDPDSDFPSGVHEGIDYDMPEGTPLYAPFAGTVIAQPSGGYGNMVTIQLDNGYQFRMGHMQGFAVTTGQRVDPGELLGLSGSTGNSTGPHVHVEWRDPNGQALDPGAVLDPIFRGSTFRSLNMSGAAGISSGDTSALLSKFPGAAGAFQRYMGRRPTAQELMPLIGMTPDQLTQYFRNRPSHVPGLNNGQYDDLRTSADSVSRDMFGHGVTDGMLKEMHDQGKADPTSVKFYLQQMDISGKMPKDTYQAIYQANQPHMNALYNAKGNFDPRIAAQQHARARQAGMTDAQIAGFRIYREGERGSLLDPGGGGGEAFDQP